MSRLFPMIDDDDFNLFDDVFSVPMFNREPLMRTDVREKDGQYVLDMDLPGYRKEDVKISLKDGNLTISAEHHENNDEKDSKGNILRQERFEGNCSRTFYVGRNIKDTDVHASFRNGTLEITVPTEEKKEEEDRKYIDIA